MLNPSSIVFTFCTVPFSTVEITNRLEQRDEVMKLMSLGFECYPFYYELRRLHNVTNNLPLLLSNRLHLCINRPPSISIVVNHRPTQGLIYVLRPTTLKIKSFHLVLWLITNLVQKHYFLYLRLLDTWSRNVHRSSPRSIS